MKLKTIYLLSLSLLYIFFSGSIWFYVSNMNQSVNEEWAERFTQKQVTFDKYRTLLPILREVKIAKKMTQEPAILAMAKNDLDPLVKEAGVAALEKYRLKFHDRSCFAAFVKSGNYYFNDYTNQYENNQYRYTLSDKKKDDSWFFKAITLGSDYQINVNKDSELGTVKVWINYLLKDQAKVIGIIGTGLSLESFLKESVAIDQEGIRNIFVNKELAIQLDRDSANIDYSTLSRAQNEHKTLKLLLEDEQSSQRIKTKIDSILQNPNQDISTISLMMDGEQKLVGIAYLPEIDWFSLTIIDVENLKLIDNYEIVIFFSLFFLISLFLLQSMNNRLFFKPLEKFEKIIVELQKNNFNIKVDTFGTGVMRRLSTQLAEMIKIAGESKQELEQKVEERTKMLVEASKAKSNFLANMSHEIRTPMTGMLGFVERLAKDEKDTNRIKQFDLIKSSGQTLLTIINDILDFSKIESGKLNLESSPFRISNCFTNCSDIYTSVASSKNINLHQTIDDNLPQCILGDETRLKQVIFNLLSNAIKFTSEGGDVTLQAHYKDENKTIYIAVIDTGVGIAKENLNKIFEVFTQEDVSTTRKFGGTGLGLSISSHLVKLMGSELQVESTVGKGSKFYFKLPVEICSEELLDNNDKSNKEIDISSNLQGHVLVVEDNKTNQMLMGVILDDLNITYDIANDGAEGVLNFKLNKYDAILMDENMPIMNGIEAAKHIRGLEENDSLTQTPIIAVTANALTGDKEKFINAGMDDYIPKPYTEDDIVKVLEKYLG